MHNGKDVFVVTGHESTECTTQLEEDPPHTFGVLV